MRNDRSQTLTEHLDELRKRILYVLFPWVTAVIASLNWAPLILNFLIQPLGSVIILAPTEGFLATLRIAVYTGTVAITPWIIYQGLAFILPGLNPEERKLGVSILPVIILLFAVGIVLGYKMVLPVSLGFFLGFMPSDIQPMIQLDRYLSFLIGITVPFGLIFQLPIIMFVLAKIGLVTSAGLKRQRKYAIVVNLIIAAVLTPPDVLSQLLMAVPLFLLYEASSIIVRLVEPKHIESIDADIGTI